MCLFFLWVFNSWFLYRFMFTYGLFKLLKSHDLASVSTAGRTASCEAEGAECRRLLNEANMMFWKRHVSGEQNPQRNGRTFA